MSLPTNSGPEAGIAVVVACGGTGYRLMRSLRIVRHSYIRCWPYPAGNNCVGSFCTLDFGPCAQRIEGSEIDARNVGVIKTARLLVLPRSLGTSL